MLYIPMHAKAGL